MVGAVVGAVVGAEVVGRFVGEDVGEVVGDVVIMSKKNSSHHPPIEPCDSGPYSHSFK